MRKTFKYRLYPTKAQTRVLNEQFELCRIIYNKSLELKINEYKKSKKNISLYDLNKNLSMWKKENFEFKKVHSQVLQKVQERVDLAFKHFFRRVRNKEKEVGYPRFKAKHRGIHSLAYKQSGFKLVNKKLLKLSKVGEVKIKLHREFSSKDEIKTCALIKKPTGKFFVCFSIERKYPTIKDIINPKKEKKKKKRTVVVGGDLGIKNLLTLSDGTKIENPKFLKKEEKELKKVQRKLDATPKTNERKKEREYRRKIVSRVHERIANKRSDFLFKLANKLIKKYDMLAFEKIDLKNWKHKYSIENKSFQDAAWGDLIQKILFKAESAGLKKKVVLVDPRNTSRTCPKCGIIHKDFDISKQIMKCSCGYKGQRDELASINILRLGLQSQSISSRSSFREVGE